jgi:cytochrome b561
VLYVLMALVPLTGYLGASHSKQGVQLFGTDGIVALHVAGALKPLLLDRGHVYAHVV